jgi:hypothetical protein
MNRSAAEHVDYKKKSLYDSDIMEGFEQVAFFNTLTERLAGLVAFFAPERLR